MLVQGIKNRANWTEPHGLGRFDAVRTGMMQYNLVFFFFGCWMEIFLEFFIIGTGRYGTVQYGIVPMATGTGSGIGI